MTPQFVLDLAYQAIIVCAKVSAPFLATAVVTGILINIIQTVTSIRDQSLTFIPKVVAATVVTGFSLPWVIEQILGYFNHMYSLLGQMSA